MKKYVISVNGTSYNVEVEEVGRNLVSTPAPAAPKAAPSAPKAAPAKAVPQGAETVECPMPGTVVDIKVSEGANVKAGDILVILEAMKMENEIVAPRDGKVAAINTTKGASVNAGDPLVSLEG